MKNLELDYAELGKRIRYFRQKKKLTQQSLAEHCNLVPSNISHIERATTKVSLPTLVRIANVLDVSLDELVCDSLPVKDIFYRNDINLDLSDCNELELQIIKEIVKTTKKALKKNHI